MTCPPTPWNPETEEILLQLYNDGKAFSSISGVLCGKGYSISRSAVAGKISRMRLPPRIKQPLPKKQKRPEIVVTRSLEQKTPVVRSPYVGDALLPPDSELNRVPFLEIRDGQCKAIIGYLDGQLSRAVCCGKKTPRVVRRNKVMPMAWCEYHMSLYTQEDL